MSNLKKTLFGICTFAVALCSGGAGMSADEVVICPEKGEPATIILPEKYSRNTEHAAKELQLILGKIIGKQFKISEKPVPGTKIFLGRAPDHIRMKMKLGTSFAITSKGNLYLGGWGKNATLHAVYHFLQDELQYRVLSPFGDEFIPQKKEIKVKLGKTYTNGVDYRCLMTYIYQRDRKTTFEFSRTGKSAPKISDFCVSLLPSEKIITLFSSSCRRRNISKIIRNFIPWIKPENGSKTNRCVFPAKKCGRSSCRT